MSTRSGKRLHNSFRENELIIPERELVVNSERKTRSRCLKENIEHNITVNTLKKKKRTNYVTYPHERETVATADTTVYKNSEKAKHNTHKNALKDSNTLMSSTDSTETIDELKKPLRTTRRTRKFSENTTDDTLKVDVEEEPILTVKSKKGKKQKKIVDDTELGNDDQVNQKQKKIDNDAEHIEEDHESKKQKKVVDDTELLKHDQVSKKKLKKKKTKRSGSIIVEDIEQNTFEMPDLNKKNTSIDSFHSAAGSIAENIVCASPPDMIRLQERNSELLNNTLVPVLQDTDQNGRRKTRSFTRKSPNTPNKVVNIFRKRKSSVKDIDEDRDDETWNKTIEQSSKKSKSSLSAKLSNAPTNTRIDNEVKNTTFDIEQRKSIKNTTFDKSSSEIINTTYNKDESKLETTSSVLEVTLNKNSMSPNSNSDGPNNSMLNKKQDRKSVINTTYEKSNSSINESSVSHKMAECHEKSYDTNNDADQKTIQNDTYDAYDNSSETCETKEFDKSSRKSISQKSPSSDLNSTFDKKQSDVADTQKRDPTTNNNTFEKKSSLLSSDNSNITLDKSDISRISITSDESKEVINTTPFLIESSLEESQMMEKQSPVQSSPKAPVTPLKREGTFTKDSEVVESPKPKTPIRSLSVSSPGCTPFPFSKSGSKERPNLLNVTRSMKKRRSSLAEPLPRATKVMFCSPINNPLVVMQQTKKVVKSSLKGSNKSFVFYETLSERRAPRKRSHTHGDAEDACVKRLRLDGQKPSGRLNRHRTTSANPKLAEPVTPSKKTPSKSKDVRVPRTKLPNFAALHQKQFDKMESLDECQERKAKRAKLLLTPTGAVNVLERISPKDLVPESPKQKPETVPEPPRPKTEPKPPKESKKPETPVKSLPTLKSLNPGYTRFGFKLNLDVNPFSGPSKDMCRSEGSLFNFSSQKSKPKVFQFSASKQNNQPAKLTRQATLPSLEGTTSVRRELAKKTVTEKSLGDKRVVKRNENRNDNRTVIKGVRTNRRFELQMRMRNFD